MIQRLEFYVRKRQLGIAEEMANEFRNEDSTSTFKESGYAILSIVLAYFEMIEQFERGQSSHKKSLEFFRCGFKKVYPATNLTDGNIDQIYSWVRCGMYHTSLTKGASPLSRHYPVGFDICCGEVQLNPGKAVQELLAHFEVWIGMLKNPTSVQKRSYFENFAKSINMDRPESEETPVRTTASPWEQG